MNAQEKEIVAFHESGHAIVAESVEHADPVHKISIIPCGIAALGYTQQQPTEDRYLLTRSELIDRLAVLLGGRVAEELVFNEISTGAQNDLQRASEIARAMVTEYGMSDSLGLVSYERPRQPMFLPESFSQSKNYSEAKAAQIDDEVTRIIDEAHQRVHKILSEWPSVSACAPGALESCGGRANGSLPSNRNPIRRHLRTTPEKSADQRMRR